MLDLSPRRSVLIFRDFVGGDSFNIVVIRLTPSRLPILQPNNEDSR